MIEKKLKMLISIKNYLLNNSIDIRSTIDKLIEKKKMQKQEEIIYLNIDENLEIRIENHNCKGYIIASISNVNIDGYSYFNDALNKINYEIICLKVEQSDSEEAKRLLKIINDNYFVKNNGYNMGYYITRDMEFDKEDSISYVIHESYNLFRKMSKLVGDDVHESLRDRNVLGLCYYISYSLYGGIPSREFYEETVRFIIISYLNILNISGNWKEYYSETIIEDIFECYIARESL